MPNKTPKQTKAERYSANIYWYLRGCEGVLYYQTVFDGIATAVKNGMSQKYQQDYVDGWNSGTQQLILIETRATND